MNLMLLMVDQDSKNSPKRITKPIGQVTTIPQWEQQLIHGTTATKWALQELWEKATQNMKSSIKRS